MGISEQLFSGTYARAVIEDTLDEYRVPYESIGWDYYDCSLEIYGVAADWRASDELRAKFDEWGFSKVYVNHVDFWETHYSYLTGENKKLPVKAWRVSYPHKRGEEKGAIWVEEWVPSWPQNWFDTGYVIIKGPSVQKVGKMYDKPPA